MTAIDPFSILFLRPPHQVRNAISQFNQKSVKEIKTDKYERYHEVVRREAYLHLCDHTYYAHMHGPILNWLHESIMEIQFNVCVELGCGVGHWIGSLYDKYPGAIFLGVDSSYQMLRVAQKHWIAGEDDLIDIQENGFMPHQVTGRKARNMKFVQADILNLPLKDSICDLAISILTMDRLKDIARSISEVERILERGGYFLLVCPFNFQSNEQWQSHYPIDKFISAFDPEDWSLVQHKRQIPYFVPLDINNNRVVYNCQGLIFQKK